MPHAVAGFEVFGLIRSVIGIIAAIAFIWLAYKLGKLQTHIWTDQKQSSSKLVTRHVQIEVEWSRA